MQQKFYIVKSTVDHELKIFNIRYEINNFQRLRIIAQIFTRTIITQSNIFSAKKQGNISNDNCPETNAFTRDNKQNNMHKHKTMN